MSISHRLLVYVRVAMFAVATFGAVGLSVSRPDAHAQLAMTAKDAQQDEHMVAIDARADQRDKDRDRMRAERDAQIAALNTRIDNLVHDVGEKDSQLSSDEGWVKGIGFVLGLLSAGGLVLSFKTAKKP